MMKLQNRSGETLVETLVALLIATLVCLFLATAIVTSTRVNEKVRDTDVSFRYEDSIAAGDLQLKVVLPSGTEYYEVQEYTTSADADVDAQYRYYTYK